MHLASTVYHFTFGKGKTYVFAVKKFEIVGIKNVVY
jgi:hypothetical protein